LPNSAQGKDNLQALLVGYITYVAKYLLVAVMSPGCILPWWHIAMVAFYHGGMISGWHIIMVAYYHGGILS
jgi:hypothetical protein